MSEKEFTAILTLLVSALLQHIESEKGLTPQEAATLLYSSKLFMKLRRDNSFVRE